MTYKIIIFGNPDLVSLWNRFRQWHRGVQDPVGDVFELRNRLKAGSTVLCETEDFDLAQDIQTDLRRAGFKVSALPSGSKVKS